MTITKTETVNLAVSRHTVFDPGNPSAGHIHNMLMCGDYIPDSWTKVGTAEVTATFLDRNTMTLNAISSLEKERDELKLQTQMRVSDLDDQIKRLQAITYQPEEDVS